jgi:hypothetical protein
MKNVCIINKKECHFNHWETRNIPFKDKPLIMDAVIHTKSYEQNCYPESDDVL